MLSRGTAWLVAGLVACFVVAISAATTAVATPNPHPLHFEVVVTACSTVQFSGGNQSAEMIRVVRGPVKKTWTPPLTPSWQFEAKGLKPGLYRFVLGDMRATAVVTSCKRGLAADVWEHLDCKNEPQRQGLRIANIGRNPIEMLAIEASREGNYGPEVRRNRVLNPGKYVILYVRPVEGVPTGFSVVVWRQGRAETVNLLLSPPKC